MNTRATITWLASLIFVIALTACPDPSTNEIGPDAMPVPESPDAGELGDSDAEAPDAYLPDAEPIRPFNVTVPVLRFEEGAEPLHIEIGVDCPADFAPPGEFDGDYQYQILAVTHDGIEEQTEVVHEYVGHYHCTDWPTSYNLYNLDCRPGAGLRVLVILIRPDNDERVETISETDIAWECPPS